LGEARVGQVTLPPLPQVTTTGARREVDEERGQKVAGFHHFLGGVDIVGGHIVAARGACLLHPLIVLPLSPSISIYQDK